MNELVLQVFSRDDGDYEYNLYKTPNDDDPLDGGIITAKNLSEAFRKAAKEATDYIKSHT